MVPNLVWTHIPSLTHKLTQMLVIAPIETLVSREFMQSIPTRSVKQAIIYTGILIFVLVMAQAARSTYKISKTDWNTLGEAIEVTFPDKLEVRFSSGRLEINQETPYAMIAALPGTAEGYSPYPFLVFATNDQIKDPEIRRAYGPLLFLTESHLLFLSYPDYSAVRYPSFVPSFTVTEQTAIKIRQFLSDGWMMQSNAYLVPVWLILTIWEIITSGAISILWILIASVLSIPITEILTGGRVELRNSLKSALFSFTLPTIIQAGTAVFGLPEFPWLLLALLYLIWVLFIQRNFTTLSRKESSISRLSTTRSSISKMRETRTKNS